MKYNLNFTEETHSISFSSMVSMGSANREACGFQWRCGDKVYFHTFRRQEILSILELELYATQEFFRLLHEIDKEYRLENHKFELYFRHPESYELFFQNPITLKGKALMYVNNIVFYQSYLVRLGYEFEFFPIGNTSAELENKVLLALEDYNLHNDFQIQSYIFSIASLNSFEDYLFNFLEGKKQSLVEYISPTDPGIPGPIKRFISMEDEICMNTICTNLKPDAFPPNQTYLLSRVRRMVMTIRDSDLALLITPFDGNSFVLPDAFFALATNFYNIPIFILDSENQHWYTKSISERRDYVRAKKLPELDNYLNIAIFANSINLLKTWGVFKKTLWR